jgi:Tat-targeted selenate reductase subunit YnfE
LPFGVKRAAAAVQSAVQPAEDKVVWGACSVNCGSRCALRLHVRDDEVYWVETDNTGEDIYGNHQVRACLRGRSIRRRINHPDRLNYPMNAWANAVKASSSASAGMKRWTITASLKDVVDTATKRCTSTTPPGLSAAISPAPPYASLVARLMNCYGGFLSHYGTYSTAQIACAMPTAATTATAPRIENTKLVVMFGNHPADTRRSDGGISDLTRSRLSVDPLLLSTRQPDAEMMDPDSSRDRCRAGGRSCLGNDSTKTWSTSLSSTNTASATTKKGEGAPNGTTKRIFSARAMTERRKRRSGRRRIPADRIIKLAREIGSATGLYLPGLGSTASGERRWSSQMLPILTGNVGSTAVTAARVSRYTITIERRCRDPVKTQISCFSWTDAIARGPEMTALRDGCAVKISWMCRLSSSGTTRVTPSSTSTPISIKPTISCRMKASAK